MDRREPDDLYERDFVAWAEAQAAALRARGAGANTIDWERVAEEIEDMGRSEVDACESYVEVIVEHVLKIMFSMSDRNEPKWRQEITAFRIRLARKLTPTIRRKLEDDFDLLYRNGRRLALADFEVHEPHNPERLPERAPFGLADLLDEEWMPKRA